jgi:hypothetical protein
MAENEYILILLYGFFKPTDIVAVVRALAPHIGSLSSELHYELPSRLTARRRAGFFTTSWRIAPGAHQLPDYASRHAAGKARATGRITAGLAFIDWERGPWFLTGFVTGPWK